MEYITIRIPKRQAMPVPDKEQLKDLYIGQRYTREDLARHYGVSASTIARWLREIGVFKHANKQ